MVTLFNAVGALLKHQERSLNLGTSERNSGIAKNNADFSADEQAEEDGRKELAAAEDTCCEDLDEKDFVAQTEELEQQQKVAEEGLRPEQLDKLILSQCSRGCSYSIASELNSATVLIEETARCYQSDKSPSSQHRNSGFISVCDSDKVAGIISHAGQTSLKMHCPICSTIAVFKLHAKKKRVNNILTITDSLGSIGTVLSSVQLATCTTCGCNIEINPASFTDVSLTLNAKAVSDREETADRQRKDTEENPQSPSTEEGEQLKGSCVDDVETEQKSGMYREKIATEQKNRKEQFNAIRNDSTNIKSEAMLSAQLISTAPDRLPVIDPAVFDAHTFGMTPAFVKSRISTALLAACGTQFSQLGAPKNRTFNYFEGNGFPLSREHLTGAVNAFARAYLHPVTEAIRADIVKRSSAVIMDESTFLVRESARRKQSEGKSRKSQIWTLSSNWTSDIKASWFSVSENRSYQNVLYILGDELKEQDNVLAIL